MINVNIMLKRNQVFYNLHIAERVGLLSAVFIQYLIDMKDAMRDKLVDNKYFILSRQQIAEATAMDDDKILAVEGCLLGWDLIQVNPVRNSKDKFYYGLNEEKLIQVISSPRDKVSDVITKPGQKKSLIPEVRKAPLSGRQQTILDLKKSALELEADFEMKEALVGWIDGVYANPNGFLSVYGIKQNLLTLNNFCGNNKSIKLKVLNIAAVGGYKNLEWAINDYNKNSTTKVYNNNTTTQAQTSLPKVDSSEAF